jgi:ABC-type multidrug transport system ATPase subunit
MLQRIKTARDLTVILTTHYMDEADKLCDRIAIVDHGKLVALDSPLNLKASIPDGTSSRRASLANLTTGARGSNDSPRSTASPAKGMSYASPRTTGR